MLSNYVQHSTSKFLNKLWCQQFGTSASVETTPHYLLEYKLVI